MTSLTTSYAMRFNKQNGRVGTLFQNRFKSKLCDTDSYFLGGSRYILLNAIHAGLARSLEEYPWSSYHELFGTGHYQIIDQEDISRLAEKTFKDREAYKKFLLDGIKLDQEKSEYGFEREVSGPALFSTFAHKKFIRRRKSRKFT